MHSWNHILRRLCLGLAVLGAAGAAYAELGNPATNSPACCQLTTSLINEVIRGEDVAGDERFFAADGAPPNIHFLIDTSGSMQELPQVSNSQHVAFFNATSNGCVNTRLDGFQTSRGWDPSIAYPVPDPGTGMGGDTGFPNLFQDSKFYAYMHWGSSTNPPSQWNSKEEACQSQVPNWNGSGATEYQLCLTCLSTKGYFKQADAVTEDFPDPRSYDFIFWGRFLNFNPPKYVTAKAVLKTVIKDLKRVRVSMSHFFSSSSKMMLTTAQSPATASAPACNTIIQNADAFDPLRQHYIASVNSLTFGSSTPLARSLLNSGYYFTSGVNIYRDVFGFGTGFSYSYADTNGFKNTALNEENRSVCWGCQSSSIIVITDGEPRDDTLNGTVITKLRTLNGGPVYCPDSQSCGPGPIGQRDKGTNPTNTGDDNVNYYLDDVAKLLHEQDLQRSNPETVGDLNTTEKQSVNVYTVGFGINSNLLKHTAEVGGGLYYSAEDAAGLKSALLSIINNVVTRATSFSSPAASALQVRSAGATLIPRFKPARSATEPWQGFLYRFNMGPERLLGCDPREPAAGGDLNNDGDCNDTHLLDAAGDAIKEDKDGKFVKLLSPLTPAVPFWEAGEKLRPANVANTTRWTTRRIYTIIDSNNDGRVDFRDTPVEFSEANAAQLREYLGISQNPDVCSDLAARLGEVSLSPEACARLIIRWYRGADALNPDPARRGFDREFLLHDIFHSSPVEANPPVPRELCPFYEECLQALVMPEGTPQQKNYSAGDRTEVLAYDKYEYEAGDRDRLVLVGSNGGMLHAFHNGQSTGELDTFTNQYKFDSGTGEELWAFIPPDLLPKLRPNLGKHAYFVDGSPMVRHVWMDGTGGEEPDGKKQWKEFRNVAIVGTGRGGVHRFALDLTRLLGENPGDSAGRVPNQAGDFLWMWPQPCDPLALQVAEGFTNFSPKQPPMGPVALSPEADDALRALYGGTGSITTSLEVNEQAARERWVVGFNGGFDQSMTRGRGFALVDIRSGHTVWSFFNNDGQPNSEHLRYPVAAGMSLFDLGETEIGEPNPNIDYLWDSGTVGDYGGQVWMLRMYNPGQWNGATQRVNNWFAARTFRVANLGGKSVDEEAVRAPITFQTLNAVQPGTNALRTFVGTGDRENLLEKGSACRLSNPLGCAAQGCAVNATLTVQRGGSLALTSTASYEDFSYESGQVVPGTAGPACGGSQVTLAWDNNAANGCSNGSDGSIQYTCDGDTTTWNCRETANTWTALNYVTPTQTHPQRYYGFRAFTSVVSNRTFDDANEALTYDGARLTDDDLTALGGFDPVTGEDTGQPSVDASTDGWYINYAIPTERTGGSGTIVAGCVLWQSFEPSGSPAAVCSTTGTNVARLYQSRFTTGAANCVQGFYDTGTDSWARFTSTTTVAAPPEPAVQVSIGGGQITTSLSLQGPGTQTTTTVNSTTDSLKSLYQLELDRRGHECRHVENSTACE